MTVINCIIPVATFYLFYLFFFTSYSNLITVANAALNNILCVLNVTNMLRQDNVEL